MRNHQLETVDPERAALAGGVPFGREHDVLHHELRPALEEISKAKLAVGPFEDIVLADLDPGQLAALFAELFAKARELLLAGHVRLAGLDPFLARYDLVRLHMGSPLISHHCERSEAIQNRAT